MCMTKPPISLYQSLKLKRFFKMFLKKKRLIRAGSNVFNL